MQNRILIVRLSAVGDTILNLPVLCALRNKFPDAKIGWVVGTGAADILRGHPDLDDLIVLSNADLKSLRSYFKFLSRVRAWKPNIVIDAQGLTKSSLIGWFSGAKQRIGFAKSEFEGRELSGILNNILIKPQANHVVTRGLELLKPLGIENPPGLYKVPVNQKIEDDVAQELLRQNLGESCSRPFAILNVGAGWPSKMWPVERYATVAKHLAQQWKLPSVVAWGAPQEKPVAEQVAALSEGTATTMPPTSLLELSAWIRQASLFIGSDTGPMHLSVAIDTPTIALIGPMPLERVGPMGNRHRAIQCERLSERERNHRKTDMRPMLSIQTDDVIDACDSLLSSLAKSMSTKEHQNRYHSDAA